MSLHPFVRSWRGARRAGWCRACLAWLVLSLLAVGWPPARPIDASGAAYVPAPIEMTALVTANLAGYSVQPGRGTSDGWDGAATFTLITADNVASVRLTIAASVLASPEAAAQFARTTLSGLTANARPESVRPEPGLPDDYGLDGLAGLRFVEPRAGTGTPTITLARLARFGPAVVLVSAVGPVGTLGDQVPNDQALALVRTFELVVGKLHWYPSGPTQPVTGLAPLVGSWSRNDFGLSLDRTGHGEASWRVYTWCSEDPTPPCDEVIGSTMTYGGSAAIAFYHVDGQMAQGVVIGSQDDVTVSVGPVTLTLLPYGMARLSQSGRTGSAVPEIDLCGPDFYRLAPADLQRQTPCGP